VLSLIISYYHLSRQDRVMKAKKSVLHIEYSHPFDDQSLPILQQIKHLLIVIDRHKKNTKEKMFVH